MGETNVTLRHMAERPSYDPNGDYIRRVLPNAREDRDLFEDPKDAEFWADRLRELHALSSLERELQEKLEEKLLELARNTMDNPNQHTILGSEARRWLTVLYGVKGNREGGYLLDVNTTDGKEEMVRRVIRKAENERIVSEQRDEQEARDLVLYPAVRDIRAHMQAGEIARADPIILASDDPALEDSLRVLSQNTAYNDRWEPGTEGGAFEITRIDGGLRVVEWETSEGRRKIYNIRDIVIPKNETA